VSKPETIPLQRLQRDDIVFILIVGLVSLVCIIVFLVPSEIQNMLKVRHAVFNPIAYITASFVHGDLQHLGLNLSAFLIFSFLLYFVNKRVSTQKFFFCSFLVIFFALPVLNYGLLFYYNIYRSIGFAFGLSLVAGGLVGFTVPSLILYFKSELEKFNSVLFFVSMVLFTLSLVSLPYEGSFRLPLPLLCAMLGFVFGFREIKRIVSFLLSSLRQRKNFAESFIVIFTFYFYFFSIIGLFPPQIASQGGIIDIISHYIGLLFGAVIFSFYSITKGMKKTEIILPLKRVYGTLRFRKLESITLLVNIVAIILFIYFFIFGSIDLSTFIGSSVPLSITALLVSIKLAQSINETKMISNITQYMIKGDHFIIDQLLGKFIADKWAIQNPDPVSGFFDVLEDLSNEKEYEMKRRISESLPALFRWKTDRALKIAEILRQDWDSKKRSDNRRRVVESIPYLLPRRPEKAELFLDYYEKDEVFTAMAVIEVAHEWLKSNRKKLGDFVSEFLSKVQGIYNKEEIEGLIHLHGLMKTLTDNLTKAVKQMKTASKSNNVYIRIGVARNLSRIARKFPKSAFQMMQYFLRQDENKWVRKPIAKENNTRAVINALHNPQLKDEAKSVLLKLFTDSDKDIRKAALDLVDELVLVDRKLSKEIISHIIKTEKDEEILTRALKFQKQILNHN
jgi:membrane associated rhomboid family serine protease